MLFTSKEGYQIDLTMGIDCSVPISNTRQNVTAWNAPAPSFDPVTGENWVGLVEKGCSVNFRDIHFNPHSHGTHTECLGHITKEIYSVNQCLTTYFFTAVLQSVAPIEKNGDNVVPTEEIAKKLQNYPAFDALLIRTLPNETTKKQQHYSNTNPPYLEESIVAVLEQHKVQHLLVDLPSVDKEDDGGVTAVHHGFFGVPDHPHHHKTITELIFVPNHAKDGKYLLNLQFPPFENDAAPSRPVLYELMTV